MTAYAKDVLVDADWADTPTNGSVSSSVVVFVVRPGNPLGIDSWDDLHVDWDLHPAGRDRVLAVLTMRGRGRASGAPVEMRAGQLWLFREDGAAVRMVLYYDLDEARQAAGL